MDDFFLRWERNQNNEKWPLIIGVFFLGVRVAASLKFFIKQWVSGNPPRSPWLKQPTEVVVSCYVDGKNMPSRKAIDEDGFSRCWGGGWADLDIGTLGKGPCQLEIGGRYLYDFFFRLRKSKSFVFFGGEFGHKVASWNFRTTLLVVLMKFQRRSWTTSSLGDLFLGLEKRHVPLLK